MTYLSALPVPVSSALGVRALEFSKPDLLRKFRNLGFSFDSTLLFARPALLKWAYGSATCQVVSTTTYQRYRESRFRARPVDFSFSRRLILLSQLEVELLMKMMTKGVREICVNSYNGVPLEFIDGKGVVHEITRGKSIYDTYDLKNWAGINEKTLECVSPRGVGKFGLRSWFIGDASTESI